VAAGPQVTRRLRFLTVDQVVDMHDALLERFGGLAGGEPRGESYQGVDAAVQAVKNSYYETAEEIAAAYAVYIVQGHVFFDGNKRTGAAAMLTFLGANRVSVAISGDTFATMMIDLQQRSEAGESATRLIADIAAFLSSHGRRPSRSSEGGFGQRF
jgi:death-on-curing protein